MILRRRAGPHTDGLERGFYSKSLKPSQKYGWAIVCCPECGRLGTLGSNHVVDDDGNVMPSLVCPFPPCSWHVVVILEDWARKDMDEPVRSSS